MTSVRRILAHKFVQAKIVEAPRKRHISSHGSLLGKQRKTKELVESHP